jgi:UDP-N-acetylmuramyl pentapeptide phosphotransferase/UDP-N-acetylglucosamine-1-phosphate transferase
MITDRSLPLLATPALAFLVTLALIWWLVKGNIPVLDLPNARSLHATAVPRTGGLGLLAGILASWALLPVSLPFTVWLAVIVLACVSFADDIFDLPVWVRLLTHGVFAIWFSAALLTEANGWLIAAFAALAITWMLNLYNFMDGSDGLAGGMALIGFGCYGVAAWLAGDEPFAAANFCVAASAAAFLLFNFHPARIFLGDSGSIPLGFLAAAMGIIGWVSDDWPAWLPLLVFSPFIADASVTLLKRGWRGEKVWQAHRQHYYQRMVQHGLGHRNTALLAYILMLASGASAMWATRQDPSVQFGVGIIWCAVYLTLMGASDHYWERRSGGS